MNEPIVIKFPDGKIITIPATVHTGGKRAPKTERKTACKHIGGVIGAETFGCNGVQFQSTWQCLLPEASPSGKCAPLAIANVALDVTTCATCPYWEKSEQPGLVQLGLSKLKSEYKWRVAGSPMRTQREIDNLFKICNNCPFMDKDRVRGTYCGKCGCPVNKKHTGIINKLAMATEICPDIPPRWQ